MKVHHRVLAAEASDTKGKVLHDDARRLPVDEVAALERVLEHGHDGVNIIRGLWADVLEDEREGLQTTRAVFVQDGGDIRDRTASPNNGGDSDRTADTALTLLHAQVGEQDLEDVQRTQALRDVTERVDGRTTDTLLVRLEQVEKLEADMHPFTSGHELGTTIGNTTNQVDCRLMTVTEDRRQTWY